MNEHIHSRHYAFRSIRDCYRFFIDYEILPEYKNCEACRGITKLIILNQLENERIIYRCTSTDCQAKRSIYNSKLRMHDFIFVIFKLLTSVPYKEITRDILVSKTSLSSIRKKLARVFELISNEQNQLLGGVGVVVECDETVLCRRGIIQYPTTTDDNTADTTWILGCIENTQERKFLLKRIVNRRIETLTRTLEGKIFVGSIFNTDGYPSYPQVASNLCLTHNVVNHINGFVATDGTHTNNIEGFWSELKLKMRKEHGVKRERIDDWLIEFSFLRKNVFDADVNELTQCYCNVLKRMFN